MMFQTLFSDHVPSVRIETSIFVEDVASGEDSLESLKEKEHGQGSRRVPLNAEEDILMCYLQPLH